jgi:hypothetical protein
MSLLLVGPFTEFMIRKGILIVGRRMGIIQIKEFLNVLDVAPNSVLVYTTQLKILRHIKLLGVRIATVKN